MRAERKLERVEMLKRVSVVLVLGFLFSLFALFLSSEGREKARHTTGKEIGMAV